MTNELLLVITGVLLFFLGVLLLILKLRGEPETNTYGKAARAQAIVLSIGLIISGLIMAIKNI